MKELRLEVESLEERIAPWCCDCSLVSVSAPVTVSGYDNNVNVGNAAVANNIGSGAATATAGQQAGGYSNTISTTQFT